MNSLGNKEEDCHDSLGNKEEDCHDSLGNEEQKFMNILEKNLSMIWQKMSLP